MPDKAHPDVQKYYSYTDGQQKIHLRIVALLTNTFPRGLSLDDTFVGFDAEDRAEEYAIKVQEYLDQLLQNAALRELLVRH